MSTITTTTATTTTASKSPGTIWSNLTSSESAFGRLIVGPVLFVSFIFSLLLIDQKTSNTVFSSPTTRNQQPSSPTSKSLSSKQYYHSHQRKLAKHDFEDAFQLRSKIIAGMVMAGGVGVAFLGWTGTKMWSFMAR